MKYKRLICINNTFLKDKLVIGKHYLGEYYRVTRFSEENFYFIYDKNKPLGLFLSNLFKTVDELRKERIHYLL